MLKRLFMALMISIFSYSVANALVSLPYETTFDCPEWQQNDSLSCDGMTLGGGWKCDGEFGDQITSDANYPEGAGGRGLYHYLGNGENNNGGGIKLNWGSNRDETWTRFYMKYPLGFHWGSFTGDKIIYFQANGRNDGKLQWHNARLKFMKGDVFINSFYSWSNLMDGPDGDGKWHMYEVYVHGLPGPNNDTAIIWVDGVLWSNSSTLNFEAGPNQSQGLSGAHFGSNQKTPDNTERCTPVSIDDIKIVDSTPSNLCDDGTGNETIPCIGPYLGVKPDPKPELLDAPTNLRVID